VGPQVTIMDADRVVVLDSGLVAEEGHPHDLLSNESGKFSFMINQTGESAGCGGYAGEGCVLWGPPGNRQLQQMQSQRLKALP
jgi:hypothetical protein